MLNGLKSHEWGWAKQAASVLEYLWVTGLAFVVVNITSIYFCSSTVSDTAIYLCMGTFFPLMAFLIFLSGQCKWFSWLSKMTKTILVLYALYCFHQYWANAFSIFTLFIIPVFCILLVLPHRRFNSEQDNITEHWTSLFLLFAISLVCWISAQNLVIFKSGLWDWMVSSWRVIPILIFMTGLVWFTLFHNPKHSNPSAWYWAVHLLALGLFVGLSFQTDSLLDYRVYDRCGFGHHWAFWVGPAESVRNGGWLLWNVPSQYGFLNILTIAVLPFSDAWESLYLLQATLLLAISIMVYSLLNRLGNRWYHAIFAALFTISTVFLLPGLVPELLTGVQSWPNIGPLRYCWLIFSVVIIGYCLCRRDPKTTCYLWMGSFCWVMGILWSFESGAFCSTVFIPVLGVMLLQQTVQILRNSGTWSQAFRSSLPYVFVPVGMLSLAIVIIWGYYKRYLGTAPDWLSYCEYAVLHVGNDKLTSPLTQVTDRAHVLLAVLCIFATITVWMASEKPFSHHVAVALGCWYAFWSSLLLFVTLKHFPFSDNATLFSMGLGLLLPLVKDTAHLTMARSVRHALLPIIAFILTITYAHPDLSRIFKHLRMPELQLTRIMYPMEPAACLLLDYAGLDSDASLVCDYYGRLLPPPRHQECPKGPYAHHRSWLPQPLVMLSVLPEYRKNLYIERNLKRYPEGGWLLIENLKMHYRQYPRRNSLSCLPQITFHLLPIPVSHWKAEVYSTIVHYTAWREVTRKSTIIAGNALLAKINEHCSTQKICENYYWSLYQCKPIDKYSLQKNKNLADSAEITVLFEKE